MHTLHLLKSFPGGLSCEVTGASAFLSRRPFVTFDQRSVSHALFAHENPSLVDSITACRALPNRRRRCLADGYGLCSTHRARFPLVGRARVLRLTTSQPAKTHCLCLCLCLSVIRVLSTKGNVLSCSNHVRVLSLDALLDHGVVIEACGCKHSAVAWMGCAVESALLAVGFLQILSFASSVPAPPGTEKAIAQQLQVFQHLGIDVATFEVWPNQSLHGRPVDGGFLHDSLQYWRLLQGPPRDWRLPHSVSDGGLKLTASVGFIPLISMMLKVFVCS